MPASAGRRRPVGLLAAHGRDLVVIAVAAFVLRAAWVLVYGRVAPAADMTFYSSAAVNLAAGHGFIEPFGTPTASWPPGFPFLMSLAFRAFGDHLKLVFVVNVLLGTATAVLLYLVGLRLFGRAGARLAGATFVVLPGTIFLTGLFLSETTFIFALVGFLALALYLPDRRWTPAALGLVIGLTALTRGEGVLMAVIPLAMWWGLPRGAWLRRAALLLGVMVLTVAPWTIRNAIVMDAFIPVASNASETLWSGHNPTANGGPTYAPATLLPRRQRDVETLKQLAKDPAAVARLERSAPPSRGGEKTEVESARALRHQAVEWAVHNPLKELGLIPRKLLALNGGVTRLFDAWINAPGDRELGTSSLIVFTILGDGLSYFLLFVTLASLALLGPRRLWRSSPAMRGILAYLSACLVVYGFVYFGQQRYRVPMEPLMVLVATPLLLAVWTQRASLRSAAPSPAREPARGPASPAAGQVADGPPPAG